MGRSRAKTSVFFLTQILPLPPGNATQKSKDDKLENNYAVLILLGGPSIWNHSNNNVVLNIRI